LIVVPELGRSINPLNDAIALWKLHRLIRSGRYHVVHTHSAKASVLGRIAAKLAGTPLILETLHGHVFHSYQPWMINRLWRMVYKLCAVMTDHFISVSDLVTREAIVAGVGHPDKFSTIYSGMELDWFLNAKVDSLAVRREFGIHEEALVVGKIARLFSLKGHDQLLDAAPAIVERHPEVRFFLVGDGVLYEHLRRRARELGILKNFVFAGFIPRERVPQMLSAMDVVVHTSLREGLARVLPQALAMGKPCVSFDIGGAAEVIIPGETGYIVKPKDTVGLAEAVLCLWLTRSFAPEWEKLAGARLFPCFALRRWSSRSPPCTRSSSIGIWDGLIGSIGSIRSGSQKFPEAWRNKPRL
jgi:glycosyltransferase involved in cell wall biosynthesis